MKNLYESIERELSTFTEEKRKEYLEVVTNKLKRNLDKFDKNIKRLLFALIVYFLIKTASIESIPVGPLKISDIDLVLMFLPLILSYYLYTLVTTMALMMPLSLISQKGYKLIFDYKKHPITTTLLFTAGISIYMRGAIEKKKNSSKRKLRDIVQDAIIRTLLFIKNRLIPLTIYLLIICEVIYSYCLGNLKIYQHISNILAIILLISSLILLYQTYKKRMKHEISINQL